MGKLPEMSYHEKYHKAFGAVCSYQERIPAYVAKHIGSQAVPMLISFWQAGIAPVPEDAPDREKYETAYNNWLWMSKCNFEFIGEQLGTPGLEDFVQAEARALKREFSELDLWSARFISALAPGLSFKMLASQLLYEMQWRTPLAITERNSKKVCAEVANCKITELPGMEEVCRFGCRRTYALWAAEQHLAKIEFTRQDSGCRMKLTPMTS